MPKINDEESENIRVKYQASLDIFNSEGQIQWGRYNAMLVVNTVLFGLIGLSYSKDFSFFPNFFQILIRLIPIFGLIVCYQWHRMTERGFIWINHWIFEASELEKQIKGGADPLKNGAKIRSKIGSGVTKDGSLFIIKAFILLYFIITIFNISLLITRQ